MIRYLVFAWDVENPWACTRAQELLGRSQSGSGWHTLLKQPGLTVISAGPATLGEHRLLSDGGGIILGTLFRNPGATPDESDRNPAVLTAVDTERIVST